MVSHLELEMSDLEIISLLDRLKKGHATPSKLYGLQPGAIIRSLDYERFYVLEVEAAGEINVKLNTPRVFGPAGDLLIFKREPVDNLIYRTGSLNVRYENPDRSRTVTIVTHNFPGSKSTPNSERGYWATFD